MEALLPVLREFGFPIVLCIVLLWFIYRMVTDRFRLLEKIIAKQGAQLEDLEADRLRRADAHAHELEAVANQFASESKEMRRVIGELLNFIRRLTDALHERPCLDPDYRPHHVRTPPPPSSDDVPSGPHDNPATSKDYKHG